MLLAINKMQMLHLLHQSLPSDHTVKFWEKGGKIRIYINGYKNREILHYDIVGKSAIRSAKNFGNYDSEGVFIGEDDLGASILQAHGLKIIAA